MDEKTVQKEAEEQNLKDQVAGIARPERICFSQIFKLSLENKDIQMIENLWDFTSLVKLNLNNNLIERIEGLDRLVNLTWLNLSFNRIGKMEGLESLQKLEVLNLSNNKISVIENMDKLEKLTHFSVSNNLVDQLDNVLYLRKLKNLFTLNLCGNPVSKGDDYKLFIAAYFPNLTCLDYKILDEKTKNAASIKYHYVLEEMRRKELYEQQAINAEQSKKAELQLHTDAFVEFLNGPYLFKSMFKDDPEVEMLHSVPEVAQLLQTFENQMVELCMQLFEIGMAEHHQRETEVKSFFSAQDKAIAYYQQKASQILADFDQQHRDRLGELQQLQSDSRPKELKDKFDQCKDEISHLSESLMSLEFQMASQMEDIFQMLDISVSDMVGNFSGTVQGIFTQCRDLEDNYYQNVQMTMQKIAVAILEKLDNQEEDMSADVRMLFSNKDTVMDMLATSHDNHLVKINDRETLLVTRVNAWKVALFKEIQEKELKWNRMHISDIHRYADHLKKHLEELQEQYLA